jgi:hypothetical protein
MPVVPGSTVKGVLRDHYGVKDKADDLAASDATGEGRTCFGLHLRCSPAFFTVRSFSGSLPRHFTFGVARQFRYLEHAMTCPRFPAPAGIEVGSPSLSLLAACDRRQTAA